jgi:hypothetical protein
VKADHFPLSVTKTGGKLHSWGGGPLLLISLLQPLHTVHATYLNPCKRYFAPRQRCKCILSETATTRGSKFVLQFQLTFIDVLNSVLTMISSLSDWLQPEYYMEQIDAFSKRVKTESLIDDLRSKGTDNAHLIIYGALIVTATLYLVGRHIRKRIPSAAFAIRTRSPDPEKPIDVTTFTANRMKPTERPPGSKSGRPLHSSSPY